MSKHKSLRNQVNSLLYGQLNLKHSPKGMHSSFRANNPIGIYSYRTFKVVQEQCRLFVNWIKEKDANGEMPHIREISDACLYVNCYLTELEEKGYTEDMIDTAAFAHGKLYGCRKTDFVTLPPRL